MSAPVGRSKKNRTAMEADSISEEDVEAKKRKLVRAVEEEDVEAEKRNNGRNEEEEEEEESSNQDVEAKKRNNGIEEEQEEEASSQGEDVEEAEKRNNGRKEEDDKDSSIVLLPGANLFFSDPKAFFAEFGFGTDEKPVPPTAITPIFDRFKPSTSFHTRQLLPVREPGSKAVLSAAKLLLGISSSLRGEPLKRCSGFWVDWVEESKTGTVLTTAHLIRTKDPPDSDDVWLGRAHYEPKANVTVHLLDGTSAEGELLYYQPHYDIAFLSVKIDQPVQLPSFNEGVKSAQKVFRLGRDNSSKLRITYGRATFLNPDMYERYHNMYFDCEDYDSDGGDDDDVDEYDDGGLVIDLDGKVVGMVNISRTLGSFIPSSILLKCLASWKNQGRILRPHLGLKFEAIKLLEPCHVDNIWRAYNIDDGLIVQEVSKGSHAEKIGIERGDVIECINGRCISTTIELENMLMSLNNEIHFSVGVFHTLKKQRRTALLTANVLDRGEVITRGHVVR